MTRPRFAAGRMTTERSFGGRFVNGQSWFSEQVGRKPISSRVSKTQILIGQIFKVYSELVSLVVIVDGSAAVALTTVASRCDPCGQKQGWQECFDHNLRHMISTCDFHMRFACGTEGTCI